MLSLCEQQLSFPGCVCGFASKMQLVLAVLFCKPSASDRASFQSARLDRGAAKMGEQDSIMPIRQHFTRPAARYSPATCRMLAAPRAELSVIDAAEDAIVMEPCPHLTPPPPLPISP